LCTHHREGLEKLLRDGARALIAASPLAIDEEGRVVYELTNPWSGAHPQFELDHRRQPKDVIVRDRR